MPVTEVIRFADISECRSMAVIDGGSPLDPKSLNPELVMLSVLLLLPWLAIGRCRILRIVL